MTEIHFGDVIQLKAATTSNQAELKALGFIEQGKNSQVMLVMPPCKDGLVFKEAEFIVSPARGDKQAASNAPLTYNTPFVLRTSDGNGYSLNNKVSGIRDGVTLHQMGIKGEMFLAVEKDGFTPDTIVHSGDADVRLTVVDSNRIRKTYNQPLALFHKPKSDAPEGFVGCGVTKNSKPLVFSLVKLEGKTRTSSFVKNADAIANDPAKADELSRADRVDSDASEMDARSRHGSLVSQTSMSVMAPASPTAVPTKAEEPEAVVAPAANDSTKNTPPVSSMTEQSAASEREAEHSMEVPTEVAKTVDSPQEPAKDTSTISTEAAAATSEIPVKDLEAVEAPVETPMSPTESTSVAEVVISEAFTATSDAPATAATMTTISSTTVVEEDPDEAEISAKGTCVGLGGGSGCSVM